MTSMENNCLAYNQVILLVALVSICEFLCFKSHQMHCWIPVMCHMAQTHSAAPHVSRSLNPQWKSCKYRKRVSLDNVFRECYDPCRMRTYMLRSLLSDDICATIPAGWRHELRSFRAEDIFVFFERGNTHCSRCKRLHLSTISTVDPFSGSQ